MSTPLPKASSHAELETGHQATRRLAIHAAGLRYEAIPAELVELTRKCILDTLGVSIGASSLSPEAGILNQYVKGLGGRPESSVLGFGGQVPASAAALINGSLGHMLDYDDVCNPGHVSIATVPLAFALAEKRGGVSGREFIAAIVAGTDLMTRLESGITLSDWKTGEGWFATQLLGFFAGAATASRLLRLNADQTENALGIGFNQMSGSYQMAVGASTHMRSMQAGFCGQGSVLAAELAELGIIGSKDVLEGRYGFFKTYVRDRSPNWNGVLAGLGTEFPLLKIHGFKVWPACNHTRPTNTAVLDLRTTHGLQPADVEAITIIGGIGGTQMLSEPIDSKRRPRSSIDAKFSIPFTTGIMMAKGKVSLRDYTAEGLNDPDILAMADKVSYRPALPEEKAFPAPIIEIRTRDGRTLRAQADAFPGSASRPVDRHFIEGKFRDCVSFSEKPIAQANIDRAIALAWRLEDADDVSELIRLLV